MRGSQGSNRVTSSTISTYCTPTQACVGPTEDASAVKMPFEEERLSDNSCMAVGGKGEGKGEGDSSMVDEGGWERVIRVVGRG